MPFFAISFTFSYSLVVPKASGQPERTGTDNDKSESQPASEPTACTPPLRPPDIDEKALSLSSLAQRLQQQAREALKVKHEASADAHSLRLLEAAESNERRREQEADEESLEVLLRATAQADDDETEKSPVTETEEGSSWSSYEAVGLETPCPSPRSDVSRGHEEEGDTVQAGSPQSEKDFEQSVLGEQWRREASGIFEGRGEGSYQGQKGVDELMKQFEELAAKDRVDDDDDGEPVTFGRKGIEERWAGAGV